MTKDQLSKLSREEKIALALKTVDAANSKFGFIPEGAAYFFATWVGLAKAAEDILLFPHLTDKEKI